jgi:predicted Rossmann fold nucleotide-binding protein DprA/Smf involved in DNA uptake
MSKKDAKKRTAILRRLREEHKDTVTRTQALFKEQKTIRRQICQAMRDAPKTVPEVAEATTLPADQVLWHIIAMKKYDLVAEVGMCGEYYQYQLVQETKK